MAHFNNAKDKLLQCPYDPTHMVKASRYQAHVAKCRLVSNNKNHLEKKDVVCPFNAQHRCDSHNFESHLLGCSDRAQLDRNLIANNDKNSTFKGHTGVPPYSKRPYVPPAESWDDEITSSPAPGYIPEERPPNNGIKVDLGIMKPSDRKRYYVNLHGNRDEIESSSKSSSPSTLSSLKPPKSTSDYEVAVKKVMEMKNIGLGRGKPQTPQPRIAANIFSSVNTLSEIRQPATVSYASVAQASALGMGRGRTIENLAPVINRNKDVDENCVKACRRKNKEKAKQ